MIQFECPHCGGQYEIDDEAAGQETTCPACGGALIVPSVEYGAPPPPPPPESGPPPPPPGFEEGTYGEATYDFVEAPPPPGYAATGFGHAAPPSPSEVEQPPAAAAYFSPPMDAPPQPEAELPAAPLPTAAPPLVEPPTPPSEPIGSPPAAPPSSPPAVSPQTLETPAPHPTAATAPVESTTGPVSIQPIASTGGTAGTETAAAAANRPVPAPEDPLAVREPATKKIRTSTGQIKELRVLSPEEKAARRFQRNMILITVGLIILGVVALILNYFGQG